MRIPSGGRGGRRWDTLLFDLENDPQQDHPVSDPEVEKRMVELLVTGMKACEAPAEQFERLGL